MTSTPQQSGRPDAIRKRLQRIEHVAWCVREALAGGRSFSWPEHARKRYAGALDVLGITLLTVTAIERAGYRLKRGVRPVGKTYFGAPLSRWADLYVLEAQAVRRSKR